mmetsp:Transcript_2090/g.3127  ORF Transcript_2090/g.3127 Transcript_2090/m.3127 type:complete len:255 (-) Transcript_2090:397-1161(-)
MKSRSKVAMTEESRLLMVVVAAMVVIDYDLTIRIVAFANVGEDIGEDVEEDVMIMIMIMIVTMITTMITDEEAVVVLCRGVADVIDIAAIHLLLLLLLLLLHLSPSPPRLPASLGRHPIRPTHRIHPTHRIRPSPLPACHLLLVRQTTTMMMAVTFPPLRLCARTRLLLPSPPSPRFGLLLRSHRHIRRSETRVRLLRHHTTRVQMAMNRHTPSPPHLPFPIPGSRPARPGLSCRPHIGRMPGVRGRDRRGRGS